MKELVEEEIVRETSVLVETKAQGERIRGFRLPMQVVVVTPDYSQTICPDCGSATKCKRAYYSHPQDIDLERPTVLQVYREVRECCNENCEWRGAPELGFVEKSGRFTKRAKQKAIASVTEDGMPLERVPQRMWRDFHVRVAKSTVHEWVHAEAEADLGEGEYTQWVVARFSGVVGIDEVHLHDENGNKQYLVVAVDPINDRTIFFDFEQMIVYLDFENLDKTNNNAERENRTYQKGEKVRYRARKMRTRLNYVKLQARRRNRRSAERDDHLRRKKKHRKTFARRVDAVVEREARRLTA